MKTHLYKFAFKKKKRWLVNPSFSTWLPVDNHVTYWLAYGAASNTDTHCRASKLGPPKS